MHDIRWIRENAKAFDAALARRGLPGEADKLIAIDERRRAAILKFEKAQARRNAASKEIGQAKAKKDEATAQKLMAEVNELKDKLPALEAKSKAEDEKLNKALAEIPNLPLAEVPDGKDETGNVEHHAWGAKRNCAFTPKQHFELGEALGMMDFETAAKLSGARFVVLKSGLARMERAIGQFMIDVHTRDHGYTEVAPPLLVRDEVMYGTAQLPKFKSDQFGTTSVFSRQITEIDAEVAQLSREAEKYRDEIENSEDRAEIPNLSEIRKWRVEIRKWRVKQWEQIQRDIDTAQERREQILKEHPSTSRSLWLIPTAEVPLTNLVRESIVEESALPMRLAACTPCFRAEAGAAGKDTRGMIRQHQFTKVELVSITTPEQSLEEHERMLACAEAVLKKLGLHYRVVTLCTGDMGFASRKTYDIEVWLPGQNMFREISSCSVCGEFQARRMEARYKGKDGKTKGFVHTLNGSGVAVGRALIAVMETYQQADGWIMVPDALAPYTGGMKKIAK